MTSLADLLGEFASCGRLEAILLRPGREEPVVSVDQVQALTDRGLEGDRASKARRAGSRRQVTLFQGEHLPLLAAWTGHARIDPAVLRRNLVISGVNLVSGRSPLKDLHCRMLIGTEVVLELTGPCDPCSRMNRELGPGGYNAMRGHGGITARVLQGGLLRVGDPVRLTATTPTPN